MANGIPAQLDALKAIDALPRHQTSDYVFWSGRRKRDGKTGAGRPEHPDTWTKRFGRLVRQLGLEGPNGPPWLHDLRRSFITLSRRRSKARIEAARAAEAVDDRKGPRRTEPVSSVPVREGIA